jgi:hypothetical protein
VALRTELALAGISILLLLLKVESIDKVFMDMVLARIDKASCCLILVSMRWLSPLDDQKYHGRHCQPIANQSSFRTTSQMSVVESTSTE